MERRGLQRLFGFVRRSGLFVHLDLVADAGAAPAIPKLIRLGEAAGLPSALRYWLVLDFNPVAATDFP